MKLRTISLMLTIITMITIIANVSASDNKQFNLIEYLEKNDICSREELKGVIESNTDTVIAMPADSASREVEFIYHVNYDTQTVDVDTVYLLEESSYVTTGQASHETYSALGKLLYTVSVTGTFTRTSEVVVTTSKSGSFTPANGSTWSCPNPILSSGNQSRTLAYARISGTASSLLQSVVFQLTLTCDTSGALHATYVES